MKHNTKKARKNRLRKQLGKGILNDGIKSKTKINDVEYSYTKKCPSGFVMCDQDEVNYSLCVPSDNQALCSDPNYGFKYIPPDETDRNATKPINRLIYEKDGKGPIQDPEKPVKVFEIEYDGEYNGSDPEKNPANILQTRANMDEEIGRLKSYAPEYHPTSCAIQQKSAATVDIVYNNGDEYKRRLNSTPITINLTKIPQKFKILTQNALGLYRGVFGQVSEIGSANEATYDLMRLRTALFRQFLKDVKPDFVCLQESTRTFVDLLDKQNMSELYPYLYPTEEEMIRMEGYGANATTSMLSRYPAKKATTYMLQGNSSYYNALGIYEFDNLVIFNVYMQAGSEISPGQKYKWENYSRCRRQQLMFIKQKIDEMRQSSDIPKGIIVLGDFNFELNSIKYKGEDTGKAERDEHNHLIYDPEMSDMTWAEHKFLVGPKGLNLNDSYKELHIDDPEKIIKEGLTENTSINTFRFLGKLEQKALRYDGIFFNDFLKPITSEVVNNTPVILDNDENVIGLFQDNGINDYIDNIRKYNTEYESHMIFNPKGDIDSQTKKNAFLSKYTTNKGKNLSVDNGFELFVSDHFGVMTDFEFKTYTGGKRRMLKRMTRKRRKVHKRKTKKY